MGRYVKGTRVFYKCVFLQQHSYSCPVVFAEDSGEEPSECVGELRLEHVSFTYPARPDVMVMRDFCLQVKAGVFVCVRGMHKKLDPSPATNIAMQPSTMVTTVDMQCWSSHESAVIVASALAICVS